MKTFYLALATALVWGIVPVIEKVGLSRLSPQAGIFVRCLAVFLGAGVLLAFKPQIIPELAAIPRKYIYLIMIAGFTANFLGQLMFYHALKGGDVSKVVPIAGAYPLISFLTGILILGEKLTIGKSLGVGCILAGVFLLK
jgi:bacterial/archaeal transporter family protein